MPDKFYNSFVYFVTELRFMANFKVPNLVWFDCVKISFVLHRDKMLFGKTIDHVDSNCDDLF